MRSTNMNLHKIEKMDKKPINANTGTYYDVEAQKYVDTDWWGTFAAYTILTVLVFVILPLVLYVLNELLEIWANPYF